MINQTKTTAILFEQYRQLLSVNNRTLITSSIMAVILCYWQREVTDPIILKGWLALILGINLARVVIGFYYRQVPTVDLQEIQKRLKTFRIGVVAASVIWGATSLLMFPTNNIEQQMLLLYMLTGFSAGSFYSYSIDFISAIAYTLFALIPLLIRFLATGESFPMLMGASGFVFMAFTVLSLRNVNQSQHETIGLRVDAVEKEKEITASEARYRMLLNHSPVGIAHFDGDLNITYCNQSLADILQSPQDEIINRNILMIKDDAILPTLNKALAGEVATFDGQYRATISEAEGWMELTAAPAFDSAGEVVGGIAIVHDVTAQKQAADEIKQLAFYDPLTKLPNRRLLLDRLDHALTISVRSGKRGALLFIDLDHFKVLNDTLGHDMGDLLLKLVAERLQDCVRDSDTVARIGGDEFVVLLEGLSKEPLEAASQAEIRANKILTALNKPYQLGKHQHHSTPSVGIAVFRDHGNSQVELLKHADIAMYQAKKAGRNLMKMFDYEM